MFPNSRVLFYSDLTFVMYMSAIITIIVTLPVNVIAWFVATYFVGGWHYRPLPPTIGRMHCTKTSNGHFSSYNNGRRNVLELRYLLVVDVIPLMMQINMLFLCVWALDVIIGLCWVIHDHMNITGHNLQTIICLLAHNMYRLRSNTLALVTLNATFVGSRYDLQNINIIVTIFCNSIIYYVYWKMFITPSPR